MKQLYLVELDFDEDLDGEAILEHCDPADGIKIRKLNCSTFDEYDEIRLSW